MTMVSATQMSAPTAAEPRRVVVGYDGSPASSNAVDWAALEAAARGWPLCMIASSANESDGRYTVPRIADRLRDNFGITVSVIDRDPTEALVEGVMNTDLFVLGPGPSNSPVPSLKRSMAPTASRRSPCPVVMVRGSFTGRIRRILLGVDGSSAAQAAIEWACDEAAVHGAEVLVVHVSEPQSPAETGDLIVDAALDECRQRIGAAAVDLSVEGSPRSLLPALTRDRDLVVVGSRGRSGFKTALFGSVAVGLADHAYCPVVITHPQPKRHREESPNGSYTV